MKGDSRPIIDDHCVSAPCAVVKVCTFYPSCYCRNSNGVRVHTRRLESLKFCLCTMGIEAVCVYALCLYFTCSYQVQRQKELHVNA